MTLNDLRAKLSGIRSQIEEFRYDCNSLWEKSNNQNESEELEEFQYSLETIEDLISDLEPEIDD